MSRNLIERLSQLSEPLPYKDGFHLGLKNNRTAIELEYAQMLYGAILDKKPSSVVEIGTASGYSASWILAGMIQNDRGHLFTVDPAVPQPPIWEQVDIPTERLTFINGLIREVLDQLPPEINILFHDAGHSSDEVLGDIDLLLPRIPVGGVVLIHDVRHHAAMGSAVAAWFDSHPDMWTYQEISSASGMGIAIRTRKPAPVIESNVNIKKASKTIRKRKSVSSK